MYNSTKFLLILVSCVYISTGQAQEKLSAAFKQQLSKTIQQPFSTLAEEELAQLKPVEIKTFLLFLTTRDSKTESRDNTLLSFYTESDKRLTPQLKKDSSFAQTTRYNVDLLIAFKNATIIPLTDQEQFTIQLDGYWQQGTSVIGSELLTHYQFIQTDRSFIYVNKQQGTTERLKNYSGFYTFTTDSIELEIRTKTILKGGSIKVQKTPNRKTKTWLSGAKETILHLNEAYEYETISISPIYTLQFDGLEKQFCRINEVIFWKCYPQE